ncbi:hypothetical protein FQA39_LY01607 [Lamprigera yunnana]|nr:hypothetical protein FQA39_LY01607 [Lamprigera yunnana]
MLKVIAILVLFINLVKGNGELRILSSPPGVLFKGHERLAESDLVEVYSAALGFTVEHSTSWTGLYITDPFNLATAIASIKIEGITSLGNAEGYNFPLKTNGDDGELLFDLSERITDRYPNENSIIADVNLSKGLDFLNQIDFLNGISDAKESELTYNHLNPTTKEDQEFIEEINVFNAVIEQIEDGSLTEDFIPDFISIKFSSLHAVSDLHGENSSATNEAKQILLDSLYRLNAALKKAYHNKALVAYITSDASHTRRARDISQSKEDAKEEVDPLNRAESYDSDYPVIFNIILWFVVVMVFSLLAIAMAIGNMDPGRDSIIYRMTSTRMKKDN